MIPGYTCRVVPGTWHNFQVVKQTMCPCVSRSTNIFRVYTFMCTYISLCWQLTAADLGSATPSHTLSTPVSALPSGTACAPHQPALHHPLHATHTTHPSSDPRPSKPNPITCASSKTPSLRSLSRHHVSNFSGQYCPTNNCRNRPSIGRLNGKPVSLPRLVW